ncbi:MAG: PEP-utilizing enzyme [Methanomicrobiales archaeon]|nr:PEP-utilizing enzyme [Methanomicrobiales archaeon]
MKRDEAGSMTRQPRLVHFGHASRDTVHRDQFGGKAAGLAEIAGLGVPVPPGFSLAVTLCEEYHQKGKVLPPDTVPLLKEGISSIEHATGLVFGSDRRPLLVSVRSGAPASMPGMMETVLNVGLSREVVRGLVLMTGNPRFAYDTYRRLIQNLGEVAGGVPPAVFQDTLTRVLTREGTSDPSSLDVRSLRGLCDEYEAAYARETGRSFPTTPIDQLTAATEAVLASSSSPRAEAYRKIAPIPGTRGTAITIQMMVFGNMGRRSGAGVAFSRNPWSGEPDVLVDFKFGAQGEEVVSGEAATAGQDVLAAVMPEVAQEVTAICRLLESHFHDMQDIEFTVQEGRVFILQTRAGKRAPLAALRIAVDMCREGLITPEDGIALLRDVDLQGVAIRRVSSPNPPITRGVAASGGAVSGRIVFSRRASRQYGEADPVILVRETANPDDIDGIQCSSGLLTLRGARTSHAAVVARQLGKVCVVNCTSLRIDQELRRVLIGETVIAEGEWVTLDGDAGAVYQGRVEIVQERPEDLLRVVRDWERGL